MSETDLNLLVALDVLLSEISVANAARRLGLSASAMSRTLSRLRNVTGDALLVRAGRSMVLTPYAETIRVRTRNAVFEAQAVLRPSAAELDLATLDRTFTLRTNEGFVEALGASLISAVSAVAPFVRLRFTAKPEKSSKPLREGSVDLEVGVLNEMGPEIRIQALFRDRFVGLVRRHHPLTLKAQVTLEHYLSFGHVVTSRRGESTGPIDALLAERGLKRNIVAVVQSFSAALAIAQASDLVALLPASYLINQSVVQREGEDNSTLFSFALPVEAPEITVSQMWHPRLEADPAHRWLRQRVKQVCRQSMSDLT